MDIRTQTVEETLALAAEFGVDPTACLAVVNEDSAAVSNRSISRWNAFAAYYAAHVESATGGE